MGGLFLDIWIEYLVRVVIRGVRLLLTKDWPVRNAKVLNAECAAGGFGCTVVTVYYEYSVEGAKYGGICEKPCLTSTSGGIYVEDLLKVKGKDQEFRVRIKRGDPSASIADFRPIDIRT